jgi:hypothetical protein
MIFVNVVFRRPEILISMGGLAYLSVPQILGALWRTGV